jgi:aspartate-semialdehyde dehydrogenase
MSALSSKSLKLALIGATGLVGRTMLRVLEERRVPIAELIPVASPKSRGTTVTLAERDWIVSTLEEGFWENADVALLSPGAKISAQWIPHLTAAGVVCIDNSSAFRLDAKVPLVVPEVNPESIRQGDLIIANPNCSTIQMVVALAPLHREFGLEEVVVATYQSAAGAGQRGKSQLLSEMAGGSESASPFPHPLLHNVIPAIGPFGDDGHCREERKMILETRKIMGLPPLRVFPTTVRVPIAHCHAEAAHLVFRQSVDLRRARQVLSQAPGLKLLDDPPQNLYPLPRDCFDSDDVFVGRLRQAEGQEKTLDLWIVADNLRKGAATNAVQILELMRRRNFIPHAR